MYSLLNILSSTVFALDSLNANQVTIASPNELPHTDHQNLTSFFADLRQQNFLRNPEKYCSLLDTAEASPELLKYILSHALYETCELRRKEKEAAVWNAKEEEAMERAIAGSGHIPSNYTFSNYSMSSISNSPAIHATQALSAPSFAHHSGHTLPHVPNDSLSVAEELQNLQHNLASCVHGGALDIEQYHSVKSSVHELVSDIESWQFPHSRKNKIDELLDETASMVSHLDAAANQMCSQCSDKWPLCFYFNFKVYLRELREVYHMGKSLLRVFTQNSDSSREVILAYTSRYEDQLQRYNTIRLVSTAEWEDEASFEYSQRLLASTGEVVKGLKSFWRAKT